MRRVPVALFLTILALVLTIAPSNAAAQDEATQAVATEPTASGAPDDIDEAARLLFDDGTREYEAGQFESALGRFMNAYDLSARDELLYNIAVCHDRLEHKAEAIDYYGRFVVALPTSPRVEIARARMDILVSTQESTAEPEGETSSGSLAGPLIMFGIAGAGLVTFTVSGLISNSRFSECESNPCDEAALDTIDSGTLVADVGLGFAAAGAIAGVLWLLLGDDDETPSVSAAPLLTTTTAGAQISGVF